MSKLNICALSLMLVLAVLVMNSVLAQQQQPQQQQQQQQPASGQQQQQPNPNCPIARARAALSSVRNAISNLPSMITGQASSSSTSNSMGRNAQNPRSGSASVSRKRRDVSNQYGGPSSSQSLQQQLLQEQLRQNPSSPTGINNNNQELSINPQQQQQLQQQTSRLGAIMQSIQSNVTREQVQQILVTLMMIMITLVTGPVMAGPATTILKEALPYMVSALMQIGSQYSGGYGASTPAISGPNVPGVSA